MVLDDINLLTNDHNKREIRVLVPSHLKSTTQIAVLKRYQLPPRNLYIKKRAKEED